MHTETFASARAQTIVFSCTSFVFGFAHFLTRRSAICVFSFSLCLTVVAGGAGRLPSVPYFEALLCDRARKLPAVKHYRQSSRPLEPRLCCETVSNCSVSAYSRVRLCGFRVSRHFGKLFARIPWNSSPMLTSNSFLFSLQFQSFNHEGKKIFFFNLKSWCCQVTCHDLRLFADHCPPVCDAICTGAVSPSVTRLHFCSVICVSPLLPPVVSCVFSLEEITV